jgi:hypothetical protein
MYHAIIVCFLVLVVKGPAADATDVLQPPCDEDEEDDDYFLSFS